MTTITAETIREYQGPAATITAANVDEIIAGLATVPADKVQSMRRAIFQGLKPTGTEGPGFYAPAGRVFLTASVEIMAQSGWRATREDAERLLTAIIAHTGC